MEKIIIKAKEGGYRGLDVSSSGFQVFYSEIEGLKSVKEAFIDPLFWQALFSNKTEALIPRQKFFSILFGDEGGEEGWNKAVEWLVDLVDKSV